MKKLKSFRKKKKSLMALESLVGIILSVIALFFILNSLFSFFLNEPTNLDVAKGNAQSIAEFINYAQSNSYNNYNCFYILKLERLENFQVYTKDNKENYFYVIDDKNVNIISFLDYPKFKNQRNLNGINILKKFPINSNQIKKDITNQGSLRIDIDFEFFNLAELGGYSNKKIIIDDNDFIVLVPYLSNSKMFDFSFGALETKISSWFSSYQNQNVLIPQIFRKKFEDIEIVKEQIIAQGDSYVQQNPNIVSQNNKEELNVLPSLILAINEKGEFFIPQGKYSELLVRNNLCSFYKLRDQDDFNYYNPKNSNGEIDQKLQNERLNMAINKKIKYLVSGIPENDFNEFIWYGGDKVKFECIKENKIYTSADCPIPGLIIDVVDFQNAIWDYVKKLPNSQNVKIIVEPEELTFEDIVNKVGALDLIWNNYFKILDEDLSSYNPNQIKEKNIYDITFLLNDDINGVKKSFSNLVQINNNVISSFYKVDSSGKPKYYYPQNSLINFGLRKKIVDGKEKIYFNSKEVIVKKYEADEKGNDIGFWDVISMGSNDNKEIYFLKIPFDSKKNNYEFDGVWDIFLTKNQFINIREFRE